jgi:hypothetical protein
LTRRSPCGTHAIEVAVAPARAAVDAREFVASRAVGDAVLRRQFGPTTVGAKRITHTLYEYGDTNVGNYSPTNVMTARDAPSILQHLGGLRLIRGNQSCFRKESKRRSSKRPAEKCFSNVVPFAFAESQAHSLILLPLQYSRCLVLSEAGKAKLLPANLVQTAVLFQGTIDLRIYFEYGLFSPGCRRQDLADLAKLDIFDEKVGSVDWAELHPYAISTITDLPHTVGALVEKLRPARG